METQLSRAEKLARLFGTPAFAVIIAILCNAMWGSAFPFIKLGYRLFAIDTADTASILCFAGVRFMLGSVLVLGGSLLLEGRLPAMPKGKILAECCALGLWQTTAQYAFFYSAVALLTGAFGGILNSTQSFLGVIFAHFLYGRADRMTPAKALGCGIAVALTICSNATMIVLRMMRAPGAWRLSLSKLGIDRGICKSMISCGLPLGFQSAAYSISNVLIQVSVNSFGADVTTAWGLSGRLDGIIWMVTEALGVSITTFSAQNFGARNYERMRKGYHTSLVLSFMLIGGLSAVLLVFSGPLSRLFVDDASISAYTTTIIHFIAPFYAIFSIIENASGSIRGAGVSLQPMILTIFGTVVLRVIWVFAIMPFDPSLELLLLVYPVTWLITATMFTIYHHSGNWLGRATA